MRTLRSLLELTPHRYEITRTLLGKSANADRKTAGTPSRPEIRAYIANMATFILIDFENVQPKGFGSLADARVTVFLGSKPSVPVELASSLQTLGRKVEYVSLKKPGKNAVDFQIAYQLGYLTATNPTASFQIVSKDTGFDSLVAQLRSRGIQVRRTATIGGQTQAQAQSPVDRAAKLLRGQKASRPQTTKTLHNTLLAHFGDKLSDKELADLIASLQKRGIVRIEGAKISYRFASGKAK